jgi:hypothetical protein
MGKKRMSAEVIIVEVIGWTAAAIILAAYILLSLGKLEGRSYLYQWMNVIGAGGFIVNSGYNGAIPSAVLNIVWAAMGLFTLWTVWRTRRTARAPIP